MLQQDGVGRERDTHASNVIQVEGQECVLNADAEQPNLKRKAPRQDPDDAASRRNLARRVAHRNSATSLAIRREDLQLTLKATRPHRRAWAVQTGRRNRAAAR
jgi:hypothetical protein